MTPGAARVDRGEGAQAGFVARAGFIAGRAVDRPETGAFVELRLAGRVEPVDADAQPLRGLPGDTKAEPGLSRAVVFGVAAVFVPGREPVGPEMRQPECQRPVAARPAEAVRGRRRAVAAEHDIGTLPVAFGRVEIGQGEDVDHPGHGRTAVKRGLRSFQNLDAAHRAQPEGAEVSVLPRGRGGVVHLDAVHIDGCILFLRTADLQIGRGARRPVLDDLDPWHPLQRVGELQIAGHRQFVIGLEAFDGAAGPVLRKGRGGCGHHDFAQIEALRHGAAAAQSKGGSRRRSQYESHVFRSFPDIARDAIGKDAPFRRR